MTQITNNFMKSISQLIYFTSCLILMNSCYKNVDEYEINLQNDKPEISVSAEIVGRVLSNDGEDVIDYVITFGDLDRKVDKSPLFHFSKMKVNKTGERIKVNKDGKSYSFVIFPVENTITYVELILIETQTGSTFNSNETYQTSIDNDIRLNFENALFKRDNIDFIGEITLKNDVLDLTTQFKYCPNTNLSKDKFGHKSFLKFEKIFNLGVVEPNGSFSIQKGATLSIANLKTNIKLYHFDGVIGYWVPMEWLTIEGPNTKFEIKEFGFYAIGESTNYRYVQGKLISNNTPIPNTRISLLINNVVQHEAFTSYDGSYFMPIPQDQLLTLSISNECGNYEKIIDKGNDDLYEINLNWNEIDAQIIPLRIYDCNNKLSKNSIVKIQNGSNLNYVFSEFGDINVTLLSCIASSTPTVTAGDEAWLEVGSSKKVNMNSAYNKFFACALHKGEYMAYDINGSSRVEWKAESTLESGNMVNLMPSLLSSTKFKYLLRFSPLAVGNISDIQITIYDEYTDPKGYSIDCKTGAQGCVFDQFVIEEIGSMPGDIISGHFNGHFTVNTIMPVGEEDAIIQGDFQVVRDF